MPDQITLSLAEYEALTKPAKPTVVVDAAEYAELVKIKPQYDALKAESTRLYARLQELETVIKREQQDHAQEYAAAIAHIRRLGG